MENIELKNALKNVLFGLVQEIQTEAKKVIDAPLESKKYGDADKVAGLLEASNIIIKKIQSL